MADEEVVVETTEDVPKPDKAGETKDTGEQTREGTPDKALQKMQQQLGTALREIEGLKGRKAEGELTQADKAKLEKAQARVEKIRQFVNRGDRDDLPSDVDPVAEHVLDLSEKVQEQTALKSQLQEANKRIESLEADRNWERARAKFSGLDVDSIWEKANADALETLGEDGTQKAVNRLASKMFFDRCEAAQKRLKDDPKGDPKKVVASTYKASEGQRAAPRLTEDEEALAMARSLVIET